MYYEIKKFVDLLVKNDPNILEWLSTPDDCMLHRHPLVDLPKPELFLSRPCNQTFGQYAYAQIKKARGLSFVMRSMGGRATPSSGSLTLLIGIAIVNDL